MAGRNFLFVPGPTNVPDRVQRAMFVPMEDHRSSKFPELTRSVLPELKTVFRTTRGTPLIFPASGSGGWEAALTNTLSPGDRVLAARFGQFSHLWIDMVKRLGYQPEVVDCEWGEGTPIERFREILAADSRHEIKAVLATHNETATGVTSSVAAIRSILEETGHPALLFVDAVSSLGSIDFRMDDWGVDICVSGSQKGLMLPAGLAILCLSPRAIAAREASVQPRCYFDFADMIRANETGYFPYTPALPLLYGLRESLKMLQEEGLENVFRRHAYLAGGVRAAVLDGWNMKLCAKHPRWYSNTVSAILLPEGVNGADVIDTAFRRYNLALGAGLSKVAGKLFRIGHLGDLNELMLLGAIAGAEMAMLDCGVRIEPGSGVAAAQRFWRGQQASSGSQTASAERVHVAAAPAVGGRAVA
ncbi:MAG TPA: aminotransferase class V-fold PLP-dependent enzyme [Steroidobacteraceae bacterium]|nr:aminotransferase class V-fold PLP-dependent enzyme [Steroidobacteraceae bacterium]